VSIGARSGVRVQREMRAHPNLASDWRSSCSSEAWARRRSLAESGDLASYARHPSEEPPQLRQAEAFQHVVLELRAGRDDVAHDRSTEGRRRHSPDAVVGRILDPLHRSQCREAVEQAGHGGLGDPARRRETPTSGGAVAGDEKCQHLELLNGQAEGQEGRGRGRQRRCLEKRRDDAEFARDAFSFGHGAPVGVHLLTLEHN